MKWIATILLAAILGMGCPFADASDGSVDELGYETTRDNGWISSPSGKIRRIVGK